MNYSPALVMGVWLGNSDTSVVGTSASNYAMPLVRSVMSYAHTEVYAKDGKWKSGQWYQRPDGIQQQGIELYPSWWNKRQSQSTQKIVFDRVSKKKATNCTPEAAREEIEVTKQVDPITKKESYSVPAGYDANAEDNVHQCSDAKPQINSISVTGGSGGQYTISTNVSAGTHALASIEILVDGKAVKNAEVSGSGTQTATVTITSAGSHSVTVNLRDAAYYSTSSSSSFTSSGSSSSSSGRSSG